MADQIRPDDHSASDWFRTKFAARKIDIIFTDLLRARVVLKIDNTVD